MTCRHTDRHILFRRNALTLALVLGLGGIGIAHGQATTGTIFGTAPAAAGGTVVVTGTSGTTRKAGVGADGRYTVGHLPVGRYTVVLQKDGQTLGTRSNVGISVGGGTEVDFAAAQVRNAANLGTIKVSANALPAIDVTSVNSSTIISAEQLQRLPLQRSAEAIALLSPGTVAGSGLLKSMLGPGGPVSFSGSSVTENAYYVNGYNTGQPYRNIGGFQLPYGSIAQQQTFTGGYSAKYGRSDGGVINQVGKRGTNQWHFGGQVVWAPRFLDEGGKNIYFPHQEVPLGYKVDDPSLQGTLQRYREKNKSWTTTYSAYVGGPLIKDKLYVFLAAETSKTKGSNTRGVDVVPEVIYYSDHDSHLYGKLDWNIDQNNILELTALHSELSGDAINGSGATYRFDYDTLTSGEFLHPNNVSKQTAQFLIAKYTGYLSENATLSVLYGKGDFTNPTVYTSDITLPSINAPSSQNPALNGGQSIVNSNSALYIYSPDAANHTHGLRVDFTYQLGDHQLGVGIDNMTYAAEHQGQETSGPGYFWIYGHGDPKVDIRPGLGVGAPGGSGYYVRKYTYDVQTSMSLEQKAWYIQDVWNVTDRLQLNLGLRNDRFTNYNDLGIAFVDEKNQWEPRLGFSWDVNGDSSFKVYGNAGRYYLALPDNVAERAANRSTLAYEYYTYTGINADGIPTGLTPVPGVHGGPPPGRVSPDNEFGQPKDAKTVTAANLKAQYQDEFILGFDKRLGSKWVYGVKLIYRKLKTGIDDVCEPGNLSTKMIAMGLDPADYKVGDPTCRLINPGLSNDILVARNDGTGYARVTMSQADWGFLKGAKRKYEGVDLYLEHPFDGKWQGRIDYTYARNRGNTEGQVRSDIGQADVSKTEDWDAWQLMQYAYGDLINGRTHSLRVRGFYQATPEWLFSGTLLVQSGTPKECLGYYGPSHVDDPVSYGPNYHWCAGNPEPPGKAGTLPWTRQLNLGVRYTPAFADHKLAFKLNVFNVLNEQNVIQSNPIFESGKNVISNDYGLGAYTEPPRYVRLSVSYDY